MKPDDKRLFAAVGIFATVLILGVYMYADVHTLADWGAYLAMLGFGLGLTGNAAYKRNSDTVKIVLTAAVTSGDVIQLPDGRAGVVEGLSGANHAIGDTVVCRVQGEVTIQKTSSIVLLDGQRAYWDRSASKVTYIASTDRDFYVGKVVGDAASSATTCVVDLNVYPCYYVDLHGRDYSAAFDHVPVLTAGTPELKQVGGTARAAFSATAEAQKLDLLSKRSWAVGAPWILEAIVEISTDADADVADLNVGVANGTHASDADLITESCFVHFDMGADNNIDAESDDGNAEVAATDTTIDWAAGTPVHIVIDGRDQDGIDIYLNGAEVLSGTAFTLAAASGPLKALFHLEKSSNDSPGVVELHDLTVRLMEQETN